MIYPGRSDIDDKANLVVRDSRSPNYTTYRSHLKILPMFSIRSISQTADTLINELRKR